MAVVTSTHQETSSLLESKYKSYFDPATPLVARPFEPSTPERNSHAELEETLLFTEDGKALVTLLFPSLYTEAEPAAKELVRRVLLGLENHEPEMAEDGEGGTYFLRDVNGENIAVFKPVDEEPFSVGNPKQALREPMKKESSSLDVKQGVQPGEGAYREVAAFLMDHQGFAKVPMTVFVEFNYPLFNWKEKQGSLQIFVPHHYESWDIGPNKYKVSDVHRIGVLDLRIFNVDRHGGNILVKRLDIIDKGCYDLIPIDHGFSLPDSVNGTDLWFEWLTWPQAKVPFEPETLRYIASLNITQDASMLRELGIREECIRTMMISTALLKRGAAKGLNLFQIANLLCRAKSFKSKGSTSQPSPVEVVATRLPSTKSRYFLSWLEMELDKLIESTYSTTVKKDTKSKQRAQEAQRRQSSTPRGLGATSRLGSSMSSSNLASTLLPPPSPGPGLTLRPSRSHVRSNSSILELDVDVDVPGLGFGSSFGPLKRNYSHEALATLG